MNNELEQWLKNAIVNRKGIKPYTDNWRGVRFEFNHHKDRRNEYYVMTNEEGSYGRYYNMSDYPIYFYDVKTKTHYLAADMPDTRASRRGSPAINAWELERLIRKELGNDVKIMLLPFELLGIIYFKATEYTQQAMFQKITFDIIKSFKIMWQGEGYEHSLLMNGDMCVGAMTAGRSITLLPTKAVVDEIKSKGTLVSVKYLNGLPYYYDSYPMPNENPGFEDLSELCTHYNLNVDNTLVHTYHKLGGFHLRFKRGDKVEHWVLGIDEGSYFASRVKKVTHPDNPILSLTPKSISDNFDKIRYQRQGEWFFVKQDREVTKNMKKLIEKSDLPKSHPNANGHYCYNWTENGKLYAYGYVTHPEHMMVRLQDNVHEVIRNTSLEDYSITGKKVD